MFDTRNKVHNLQICGEVEQKDGLKLNAKVATS